MLILLISRIHACRIRCQRADLGPGTAIGDGRVRSTIDVGISSDHR
jgi:hypothetical protein